MEMRGRVGGGGRAVRFLSSTTGFGWKTRARLAIEGKSPQWWLLPPGPAVMLRLERNSNE